MRFPEFGHEIATRRCCHGGSNRRIQLREHPALCEKESISLVGLLPCSFLRDLTTSNYVSCRYKIPAKNNIESHWECPCLLRLTVESDHFGVYDGMLPREIPETFLPLFQKERRRTWRTPSTKTAVLATDWPPCCQLPNAAALIQNQSLCSTRFDGRESTPF